MGEGAQGTPRTHVTEYGFATQAAGTSSFGRIRLYAMTHKLGVTRDKGVKKKKTGTKGEMEARYLRWDKPWNAQPQIPRNGKWHPRSTHLDTKAPVMYNAKNLWEPMN